MTRSVDQINWVQILLKRIFLPFILDTTQERHDKLYTRLLFYVRTVILNIYVYFTYLFNFLQIIYDEQVFCYGLPRGYSIVGVGEEERDWSTYTYYRIVLFTVINAQCNRNVLFWVLWFFFSFGYPLIRSRARHIFYAKWKI